MQKVDKFGQQIYQTAANFMWLLCQENIIINSINNSSNIFINRMTFMNFSKVSINSIRTSEVKRNLSVGLCG